MQRDGVSLNQRAEFNCKTFNQGKHQVPLELHPPHTAVQAWDKWLESCPVHKNLEVLVNSYLNMSQESNSVAKEAKCFFKEQCGQSDQETDCLLACSTGENTLYRKDIELIKHIQRRATKLMREAETKTYEEQLRKFRMFSLEEFEGETQHSLQLPKRRLQYEMCHSLFSSEK